MLENKVFSSFWLVIGSREKGGSGGWLRRIHRLGETEKAFGVQTERLGKGQALGAGGKDGIRCNSLYRKLCCGAAERATRRGTYSRVWEPAMCEEVKGLLVVSL